jgi:serine/threonine-protein kinase
MTPLIGWAAIVIVFFPTLLPQSPRATLATSLAAAAMAPLGYGIAHLLGADVSSDPSVLASMWIPHFVAALIAYVPARVMHGLGADLKRARRLGSYELVERIGRGGMGEVWRARHRLLVRPAAIKLIRPDSKNLDALKQRFEREAQTTATLESPHTVELYDFGISDDGAFYYVMELLRGIDLETLVERFGPQPAERVIHILSQACDSLEDAHRAGLVHRDIKPANIYVASKGVRLDHVKVLDFGLVKAREHPTDIGATAEGTIIGTPAYMAPEMTTGDSEVDGRADLYALGCVGYWLLTGKLVFPGASPMQVAIAHATKDPEPPSNRTELPVPAALEHVIMACLAKRPSDRPSSAAELADRLSAIDVASPWTDDRAAAWWSAHLAEVTAGRHSMVSLGTAPTAFLNPAQSSK